MGIYERIKELYEKAEQEAAEERARQQRETELLRAAAKVADALHAHGVEAADTPIHGWLIHRHTLPPLPPQPPPPPRSPLPSANPGQGFGTMRGSTSRSTTPPFPSPSPFIAPKPGQGFGSSRWSTSRSATVQNRTVEYRLGVDGRIYQDGKPIEQPTNAIIEAIEQYLAEIVVKNHLDPELFKDDATQS